jgi:SAM-dependent methyltransferase
MRKIYENGNYLKNNPTWHEKDSAWKAKQIMKIINRNKLNPSSICEIGCGAGEILNKLSERLDDSIDYYGYEISRDAYEICKKKRKENLHFIYKDLFEERERTFDIVMAIDVFEHVEDYYGFLRKLKGKATYKIFHIPLDLSVQSILRGSPLLKYRKSVGHIHYFTKDTALAALEDVGYRIMDYSYTGSQLELPYIGWKTRLLKFPRKLFYLFNKDLAVRILGGFSLLVLTQ